MKKAVLIIGAIYGLLGVIFGAFGAHALKKLLSTELLKSFETGVRYQMYHALVLLLIGFYFNFSDKFQNSMAWLFMVGIFLFSFSIYLLTMAKNWNYSMSWLGPVTPLGGLLLILGWVFLLINLIKKF